MSGTNTSVRMHLVALGAGQHEALPERAPADPRVGGRDQHDGQLVRARRRRVVDDRDAGRHQVHRPGQAARPLAAVDQQPALHPAGLHAGREDVRARVALGEGRAQVPVLLRDRLQHRPLEPGAQGGQLGQRGDREVVHGGRDRQRRRAGADGALHPDGGQRVDAVPAVLGRAPAARSRRRRDRACSALLSRVSQAISGSAASAASRPGSSSLERGPFGGQEAHAARPAQERQRTGRQLRRLVVDRVEAHVLAEQADAGSPRWSPPGCGPRSGRARRPGWRCPGPPAPRNGPRSRRVRARHSQLPANSATSPSVWVKSMRSRLGVHHVALGPAQDAVAEVHLPAADQVTARRRSTPGRPGRRG